MSGRVRLFVAVFTVGVCTAVIFASQYGNRIVKEFEMKKFSESTVYEAGTDGYISIRIPVLLLAGNGDLLAFAEGRAARSDTGRIDLILRRSTDGGKTWSATSVVVSDNENTNGNPCPILDPDTGDICLVYTTNLGSDRESEILVGNAAPRRVHRCYSRDNGLTWTAPEDISAQARKDNWTWYATGPCHGICISAGRYIVPCNHGEIENGENLGTRSHLIFSDDKGESWQIGAMSDLGTNEATVAETPQGLYVNMRNTFPHKKRAYTISQDGGITFGACQTAKQLNDPYCQGSVYGYEGGLFFCNANAKLIRKNLTLRHSADGGITWNRGLVIARKAGAYSDIAMSKSGTVFVLYEGAREKLYDTITLAGIPADDYFGFAK